MIKMDNENIIRRVYSSIKESVITCQLPPGERLNIEVLAEQLRVSTTPVRESLNRLVAEDLIVLVPRMGFFMKTLLESEIRDLYELNSVLLDWSIASITKNHVEGMVINFPEISGSSDKLMQQDQPCHDYLVKSSSNLFSSLARQSGNSEIDLRVRNINDRLHYIRVCECEMQSDPKQQILPLFQLYRTCRYEDLRKAVSAYHDHRLKLLSGLLRTKNFGARTAFERYEA